MNEEIRFVNTERAARLLGVRPQTLRASLCKHGHYLGLTPRKLPNRLLLWSREEIDRLLAGEQQQHEGASAGGRP